MNATLTLALTTTESRYRAIHAACAAQKALPFRLGDIEGDAYVWSMTVGPNFSQYNLPLCDLELELKIRTKTEGVAPDG